MSEIDPVLVLPDPNLGDIDARRAGALVPTTCTKLGLKRAFAELGRWAEVKAAIATDPDIQEEWDLAMSLVRDDPLVEGMIAALGLTNFEVDDLLVRAHRLVE